MTRPLADAKARRRIANEFGTTFFVEAAAGTGKTTALVRRIVGLIRAGHGTLERIVAVTFTEKAAGETKLRLRSEIESARVGASPEERKRLDRALEELELTRIGTIHAFCGDVLHERPVEAAVDPLFEVASEREAQALADQAFDDWFEDVLADPPEGIRRLLRRRSARIAPREDLRAAMGRLLEHRDFPARWRRDRFDRDDQIDSLLEELAALGALASESSWSEDFLAKTLAEIERFVAEATRLEALRRRDYDGLEAELRYLSRVGSWRYRGARATTFGEFSRATVLERRDRLKTKLDSFVAASDADLAPLLHAALQQPIATYEGLKARAGRLDFLDLLIRTRDLIRDNAAVRNELQQRYTHFFVDEFQDTDPLQAEILLLLAANDPSCSDWRIATPVAGKLFLVGDPKQSIYRFRRADIALYEHAKAHLLTTGAEVLHLTTSFRAPPSIQAFVNAAFAPAMATWADGGQAEYVPLGEHRAEIVGRPTIIALPVPQPYTDYGGIAKYPIAESFPPAVGAFIGWLCHQSGWMIGEQQGSRPIQPRDIAILFRQFRGYGGDITRAYVHALEVRRIPHVLVGGRSFHDCEEVIALRNALNAIEWPDDQLSVFATLRGPFFALGDEALLSFRQVIGTEGPATLRRLDPMRRIDWSSVAPDAAQVVAALELLRELHIGRNRRPVAETVTKLLGAVRAHAGVALWPNGEQALANIQRVVDLARQFERKTSSFRAFIQQLELEAERGEADEAPIVEEGTEGVRLMTVHKAKGLEFPIVILADPTCAASRDAPTRHVDPARRLWLEQLCGSAPIELLEAANDEQRREQQEAIRIAYVSTTRARDLLVVPACGDQPIEGWLSVLNPVLYPTDAAWSTSSPAPSCPTFGADSVLDRGPKGRVPLSGPVRPGLHRPVAAGPSIVWWDPSCLILEVEEPLPVRHQEILAAGSEAAANSEAQYQSWLRERADLLKRASQPSLAVKTVTSISRIAPETGASEGLVEHPVQVIRLERAGDRPGGRRFGALVHAIFASIDFDSADDRLQRLQPSRRALLMRHQRKSRPLCWLLRLRSVTRCCVEPPGPRLETTFGARPRSSSPCQTVHWRKACWTSHFASRSRISVAGLSSISRPTKNSLRKLRTTSGK